MNDAHLQFLASPEWKQMLASELFPWVLSVADLGDDVLEVGPGPGLTTDLLRQHTPKLTAVELDEQLAKSLAARLQGANVEVIHGDAIHSGFPADRFSATTCFSVLHHIPSPELQDQLFAELYRVLRPGGAFLASDSTDDELIRQFHEDDVFVPLDPNTLSGRLEAAGFSNVAIEVGEYEIRFNATKP